MKAQRIIPVILILLTGCVTVAPKITPEMSPVKYSKPENANAMISGETFPYVLWYDDSKWNFIDPDSSLYKHVEAEFKRENLTLNALLMHPNREIAVSVVGESRLMIPYDNIIRQFERRLKSGKIELIEYDYREVNGNNVLFLKLFEQVDSVDFILSNYFLANDKGHVVISAITQPHLFYEHKNDIINILNGLDFKTKAEFGITDHISDDIELRLKGIKSLYEKGLITEEDYEKKRAEILESLSAGEDNDLVVHLEKAGVLTNDLGMEFVWVPPGEYMRGSAESVAEVARRYGGKEEWYKDEHPRHRVILTRGFYMQATEVRVGHWRRFVKETGYRSDAERGDGADVWTGSKWEKKKGAYWDNPGFDQGEDHPVTCVSWNDAMKFVEWVNKEGQGMRYRLPTEAEWEYAARAGSTTQFCFGDDEAGLGEYAWYGSKSGHRTHPVGKKEPNAWGLYDMHGNVWEWVQDWYGSYPSSAVTDSTGPSTGSFRVLRGGGWGSYARICRSAFRIDFYPDYRSFSHGFRLVVPQVP